jgi:hypothetical protein
VMFISPEYAVQGAILVPTDLDKRQGRRFYVDDVFDNDMFLCLGH